MSHIRWHGKLTLRFVRAYLKHECLWNPKHPDYRKRPKTDEAYKEISEDLKDFITMDVHQIRYKIKNLRGTYIQEVTKIMKKSTDPDHIYESPLPWFREMDNCLKDIIAPRAIMPRGRRKADKSWVDSWNHDSDNNDSDDELISRDRLKEESLSKYEDSLPDNNLPNVEDKVNNTIYLPSHSMETHFDDEYDLFGKYVAVQLRKLQLKGALMAKTSILEILSEARLSES